MKNSATKNAALGGVTAALAVVIMCLIGSLGITTYVCPVLCMLLCCVVRKQCGSRIAWAWYAAVCILSLLLAPDKEAAAVFLFIGYYPILKPAFDRFLISYLWKFLYFNASILVLYFILICVLGFAELLDNFSEFGKFSLVVILLIGNITFGVLDKLLGCIFKQHK